MAIADGAKKFFSRGSLGARERTEWIPKKNASNSSSGRKPLEVPLDVSPRSRPRRGNRWSCRRCKPPPWRDWPSRSPPRKASPWRRFASASWSWRSFATERARLPTEEIAWADEVLLNLAGYCEGRLIPFSVKTDVWLPLEPEPLLPGLYEAIVGQVPTEGLVVDLTLPSDYPVESLPGAPARFLVRRPGGA